MVGCLSCNWTPLGLESHMIGSPLYEWLPGSTGQHLGVPILVFVFCQRDQTEKETTILRVQPTKKKTHQMSPLFICCCCVLLFFIFSHATLCPPLPRFGRRSFPTARGHTSRRPSKGRGGESCKSVGDSSFLGVGTFVRWFCRKPKGKSPVRGGPWGPRKRDTDAPRPIFPFWWSHFLRSVSDFGHFCGLEHVGGIQQVDSFWRIHFFGSEWFICWKYTGSLMKHVNPFKIDLPGG